MNSDMPKVLLKVGGRTLLGHITYEWSGVVDGFVIVVSKGNGDAIKRNSGKAEFVVQKEPKGIADAILQAEPYVDGRFIVNLGDCLFRGTFKDCEPFEQGIGVLREASTDDIKQNYAVEALNNRVLVVWEKPKTVLPIWHCGIGAYFFDQRVFDYIRKTPPSSLRNEVEITDVIQKMIDAGEWITPVWFEGKYINITYPEDIKRAEEVFK